MAVKPLAIYLFCSWEDADGSWGVSASDACRENVCEVSSCKFTEEPWEDQTL